MPVTRSPVPTLTDNLCCQTGVIIINKTVSQTKYFPKAILSVNRQEISPDSPLKLTIKKQLTEEPATLPEDLQGSVLIIAPVGSVESQPIDDEGDILPGEDGWTSLLNGDGMVYRALLDGGMNLKSHRNRNISELEVVNQQTNGML